HFHSQVCLLRSSANINGRRQPPPRKAPQPTDSDQDQDLDPQQPQEEGEAADSPRAPQAQGTDMFVFVANVVASSNCLQHY
ncbi:hypothetical protein XELAEV_18033292mg, partial [Xenopus laevis]